MTQPPPSGYPDPNLPPQGQPGYQPPAQPGYPTQPGGYQAPPPGYQAPPPGYQPAPGYQPPPGYQAPPSAPPAGYASSEDKTWALVATFGAAVGSLISLGVLAAAGPLVAYLAKGKEPGVRRFALPAVNFFAIISAASLVLVFLRVCAGVVLDYGVLWSLTSGLLWLVQFVVMAVGVIIGILAGVKANDNGQEYKYPFSLNVFK